MKFSIITCTLQSDRFLEKNITSVKNQSYKDFEHIFIDGFSTDRTVDIIKRYQSEFPGQVRLYQAPPRGISQAMNEGIEKATGDYILHLHADDSLYDRNVLNDSSLFLSAYAYDWMYGKINVVDEQGTEIGTFPMKKIWQQQSRSYWAKYLLKFYNYIPHQAVFIKKSIFSNFGNFDERLTSAMDPDLWLRISTQTSWTFFNRIISNFSVHANSQTANKTLREKNRLNYAVVQKRYLNKWELIAAKGLNWIIDKKNRNLRANINE